MLGSIVAAISDISANNRSILFFHKAVVILAAWAGSGKGDLLLLAIGKEVVIDEFTAIIRVNSEQRAGQVATDVSKRLEDPHLGFVADGTGFGPPCADISDVQGLTEVTVRIAPVVADQIDFYKARPSFVPLRKGPDWYLML